MEFTKTFTTPEQAKKLLEKNSMNRPPRQKVVDFYAKEMVDGNWQADTGETIKFAKSGKLLDGQHRLLAVIKSGIGQWFHFVHGLDENTFKVLDTGAKRSTGNIFDIHGVTNGAGISALIQSWNRIKNNKYQDRTSFLSATDLLKIYKQNESFWDESYSRSDFYYRNLSRVFEKSHLGGLYVLFHHINPADAESFMTQLSTGENVTNKSILQLRKKLIESRLSPQYNMTLVVKIGLIIKTWNYYRQGKELKILKYAPLEEQLPIAS